MRITLKTGAAEPVPGAQVAVTFYMPAMPAMGMAAMRVQTTAVDQGSGLYSGDIKLEAGGTWQVTIVAAKGGRTLATKQFSVSVSGSMAM